MFLKFFVLLLALNIFGPLFASEELSTSSFVEIEKKVNQKIEKYGIKNVLVVFDIDNTVITMAQDLGSDQWFNWQYDHCVASTDKKDFCSASNMDELLDIQEKLFALSNVKPTSDEVVPVVKRLQAKGVKIVLLTSRGHTMRSATQRSLRLSGLSFQESAIAPQKGYAGTYDPYQLNSIAAYGLTATDMKLAKLGSPRSVTYQNGIYMTSGQHKGIMLKTLLAKTNAKFKAIVFADDHEKHTKRMQDIYGKDQKVDLTTYRYSAMDSAVKAFQESDKKEVTAKWKTLSKSLSEVFN